MVLREQRVWGVREKLFERVLPNISIGTAAALVADSAVCDAIVKGLPNPQWPRDPWAALQRLALRMARATGASNQTSRVARR
jgi:DNA polymerase-3 subunit delta